MTNPLVSVIIPTHNRPDLLPRAVESALAGMPPNSVEVVIIPNGGDTSWRLSLRQWGDNTSVKVFPLDRADVSSARNFGLLKAQGKFIRFLDDDDFLFPNAARRQYELMERNGLDFCSASVTLLDQSEQFHGELNQPDADSGLIASLCQARVQIPFAHVFLRSSIKNVRWKEGLTLSEDTDWLIHSAVATPRKWLRMNESVGVWFQHDKPRLSLNRPSGKVHEPTATALLFAANQLKQQGIWNKTLATTVADALWKSVHHAFPFRPVYWHQIAIEAQQISPGSRPPQAVYEFPLLHHLDPKALLWGLLPKRWISLATQEIKALLVGRNYRRKI